MIMKTVEVLALMLGVLLTTVFASPQASEAPVIEPLPSVQTWIKQVVTLETQQQLQEAITTFKKQGLNTEEVLQQLIYFQANAKKIYSGENLIYEEVTKRAMVANSLIAFLLDWDRKKDVPTDSSSQMLIDAVLPYLGTRDPALRKELHNTLLWVDQMHGSKKDFANYEVFLRASPHRRTEHLVEYMYDRDPSTAVISMARVYGNKSDDVDVANTLKDDPKAALQSLADRSEWWAHLYVAETMKKQWQLRDPAILKKLEKDDHPLVKEKVAEMMSGK